jgi:serine phosphatase RsbU (regulator of sigma subunit)
LGLLVSAHSSQSASDLVDTINTSLTTWLSGSQAADDVTLVIAKRTGV